MKATTAALILVSLPLFCSRAAQADTFGSGADTFDIEFVPIGSPNNPDDTTGAPNPAGKVEYAYRMGKYEISEDMIDKVNTLSGSRIAHDNRGENKPATSVSWFEAAQFVNWLNTSTGHSPAYNFRGTEFQLWSSAEAWQLGGENLYRHKDAYYFLPSVDEWYKAAYYDPKAGIYYDYPTGSNTAPTAVASGTAANTAIYGLSPSDDVPADITLAGGLSPYGTMGQGGNVAELEETEFDLVNDLVNAFDPNFEPPVGIRGGTWFDIPNNLLAMLRVRRAPNEHGPFTGFRVASASIPEPSTMLLGALGAGGLLARRRRLG
jgi:formylglycine-generating enzyme required for sulfatase activity